MAAPCSFGARLPTRVVSVAELTLSASGAYLGLFGLVMVSRSSLARIGSGLGRLPKGPIILYQKYIIMRPKKTPEQ